MVVTQKLSEADANPVPERAGVAFAARLTIEGVTRVYGEATALDGIDLDLAPGEIVCLLGPSGCGKTTLLRIVSGIERPTAGRVLINEQEVAGPRRFVPPEKRGVGLMFQDFALFPHLNVLENVAFGLKALPANDRQKIAQSILSRVGLASFAEAYPSTLSGGQQQRVALARAMAPRPSVMLMDEPFSGLDVQLRDVMQAETQTLLRETRATSLIVTHNPDEAMRLGDRIAVLRGGRIVQLGKAEDLYRDPASLFVARLFSEINEVPVRVRDGRIDTPIGMVAAAGLADGPAVLGIRERGITVTKARNGDGGGLAGRVLDRKFLGDLTRLDVSVQGFEQPLKVRVIDAETFGRGTDVCIGVDRASVLVFPVDNNGKQP